MKQYEFMTISCFGAPHTIVAEEAPLIRLRHMPQCEALVRMGDEGKAVGCVPPTALLFLLKKAA